MSVSGASGRSMHREMSAVQAILEARGLFGSVGAKGFVFTTTGHSPVGGYSRAKERIDVVMERLGAGKKQGNKIPPWRFHGLRRTMATGMARLKIPLPVIEKILAHSSGTFAGIVGVYQLHSFAAEKAEALEKWGNAVEKLVSGEIEKLDADTSSNASPARKRG